MRVSLTSSVQEEHVILIEMTCRVWAKFCIIYKSMDFIYALFFTSVALAKAGLVVGPLSLSVCPSVRTFGVASLCNL